MSSLADRTKALHKEAPDLSHFSLPNLSYLLRHEELWPEGFRWYFSHQCHCAIGLSLEVWRVDPYKSSSIPRSTGFNMFFTGTSNTTAAEVADRIDAYLAKLPK